MKDNVKIQALFHEFTSLSHIFVKVVTLLVQWSYSNQKAIKNMIFLIKYQILNRNPGCWWLSHKVTFLSIQLHEQIFLFFFSDVSLFVTSISHFLQIFSQIREILTKIFTSKKAIFWMFTNCTKFFEHVHFPKAPIDSNNMGGGSPQYLLRIFADHVTLFNSTSIGLWNSIDKFRLRQ